MIDKKINSYDAISFDVFDTLITRNVLNPTDIFYYVGMQYVKHTTETLWPERFKAVRTQAELMAMAEVKDKEVTLDQIYQYLRKLLNIDTATAEKLKEFEIEAEYQLTKVCKTGREIYDAAVKLGKKIFYVSDMYLPKYVVINLLKRNGYDTENYELILSSDYNKTKKGNGELFEVLKSRIGGGNVLHIGDNPHADGQNAKLKGIDYILIPNVNEQFKNNPKCQLLGKFLYSNTLAASMMASLFAWKSTNDSISDGSGYGLGYFCLGPYLAGIVDWLDRSFKEQEISKVWFLARDGYLLQKVYPILAINSVIPNDYILTSRRALSVPLLNGNVNNSLILSLNFNGSISNLIKDKLGLELTEKVVKSIEDNDISQDKVVNTNNQSDFFLISKVINVLREEIQKKSGDELYSLRQYFRAKIGGDGKLNNEKIAIVDHGCRGTLLTYLKRIFPNLDFVGFNVLIDSQSNYCYQLPLDFKINAFIHEEESSFESYSLFRHLHIMELLFSSPSASLEKFEIINGKCLPVFVGNRTKAEVELFREIERGVIDFAKDFSSARNKLDDREFFSMQKDLSFYPIVKYLCDPTHADVNLWKDVGFEDKFGGYCWDSIISKHTWPEAYSLVKPVFSSKKKIKISEKVRKFFKNLKSRTFEL